MTESVIFLDGRVSLFLGDCRQILPKLNREGMALVSDPPYGIGYSISARKWQNEGLDSLEPWEMEKRPPIEGDNEPFDPVPFIGFKTVALFGANHMAGLPTGGRWIVWDKRRESKSDDHSDCELVWTNVPGADRIHRQKWRGIVREGEENCSRSLKLHPNQKPVALISFIFDQVGIGAKDTVIDPFMGSGSTGIVAIRRGNPFIGIEIVPEHFKVARNRLEAEAAQAQLDLVGGT